MDCVRVLLRMKRLACDRLKRDQQRAALVRWRRKLCPMRERSVTVARGREAQLELALQIFWARVKVAVRGDKRKHLQGNLDRAAEEADDGNVDKVYKLLKPWVKPQCRTHQAGQWPMDENT